MIVMDCSAAVEIALNTEEGSVIARLIDPQERILAPTCFRVEVRNALWEYVHAGLLSREEALENAAFAEALITDFIEPDDYVAEAFMEAINRNCPVSDMLYLCITRRNAATLFTTDHRLAHLCRETYVNCVEEVDLFVEEDDSDI